MKKLVLIALLFSLSATTFVTAQSKQTQREVFATTYHNTKALINSQQFLYVGEMVYNNETREVLNDEINTLIINKSEVSGKVVSIKSDKKTVNVTGKIENYNVSFNDQKQEVNISFNVNTGNKRATLNIEVKPNGNAFLTVSSAGVENISWTGKLKNLK